MEGKRMLRWVVNKSKQKKKQQTCIKKQMEIIQINSLVDMELCLLYFQIAFSPRRFPEVSKELKISF